MRSVAIKMPQVRTEAFPLQGGLDLVSPALALAPGNLIGSVNFEPDINGGYRRMAGCERYDGRPRPSVAQFTLLAITPDAVNFGSLAVGATITGSISGKTAVVLQINGTTELVVTKVSGTFATNDVLSITGPINVATWISSATNTAGTPALQSSYTSLAANNYRADIAVVPGEGPVRGVWYYNGSMYAFRNNVGSTACIMFKESASGWTIVALGTEIQFTAGNAAVPVDGAVLTQGAVTATVRRVLTRAGTWTGTAVGTFVISNLAGGNFAAGAATLTGGATCTLSGVQTAITLQPGGRFEFANYNFSGTTSTFRMYMCDGVNYLSEFDGTYFVPIRTGIAPDAPKFLAPWDHFMVVAIASSVQLSGVGQPYSWTALTGAAELALGDTCSGLLPQLGNSSAAALAIYTAGNSNKTFVLYNTASGLRMVTQSPDAGAQPYTVQNIGFGYSLDTKGVVSMQTTLNFGNFIMSTITRKVQPIIDAKRGMAVASCIERSTNQYRLFFSDGSGLILYFSGNDEGGNPVVSILPFDYTINQVTPTRTFNTVVSFVDLTGIERIFAGGNDGYVYELDRGTSHDGDSILSYIFTAFNSNKSPRNRKRYKRAVLQATCQGTASVNIGYELNFGSTESDSGYRNAQTLIGNGGYWDIFTWDSFNWDAPYVNEYTIDTPGDGRNIGMVIYGNNAVDLPYTVHSCIMHYTIGRLER